MWKVFQTNEKAFLLSACIGLLSHKGFFSSQININKILAPPPQTSAGLILRPNQCDSETHGKIKQKIYPGKTWKRDVTGENFGMNY